MTTGAVGPAPLSARSVLLSVLLGSHPPQLPVRTLVRTASVLGIAEGTARVALSRLASEGEVEGADGVYRLSDRHQNRQHLQDAGLRPVTRPWRGGWELVIMDEDGANGTTAADLGRHRLAELRPGVWTRPDNLERTLPAGPYLAYRARPLDGADPVGLARRLWDLGGWSEGAMGLMEALRGSREPAERLALGAAMVRHIRDDPVLPASLLPAEWPGTAIRRAYDGYRNELGRLIRNLQEV